MHEIIMCYIVPLLKINQNKPSKPLSHTFCAGDGILEEKKEKGPYAEIQCEACRRGSSFHVGLKKPLLALLLLFSSWKLLTVVCCLGKSPPWSVPMLFDCFLKVIDSNLCHLHWPCTFNFQLLSVVICIFN